MKRLILLFLVFALVNGSVHAEQLKPKWELGAGVGSQTLADYRGSTHYQAQFLPIPYLVYRGDFIRADDGSIRGLFIKSDRFELNISADAALNTDSENNDLRRGMPELDSAFELGPSANFNLTGEDFSEGLVLRVPVRAVFAASFEKIEHIGYLFNPKLTYQETWGDGWEAAVNVGLLYGSDEYHDYYYRVAPRYATAQRPAYEAHGGYSGTYFKFGLSRRTGKLWYGVYLRYDNLNGTTFEDSPLVETEHYATLGLGISWIFAQSDLQVWADD